MTYISLPILIHLVKLFIFGNCKYNAIITINISIGIKYYLKYYNKFVYKRRTIYNAYV